MTDDHDARQRGRALAQVRYHWGEAYEVGWQSGSFWFRRRDNGAFLQCSSAAALRTEIRRDYSAMPVPQDARKRR